MLLLGANIPASKRMILTPHPALPLSLIPDKTTSVFLAVDSAHIINLSFSLKSVRDFSRHMVLHAMLMGLFSGCVAALFLYSAVMTWKTRNTHFKLHLIFLSSVTLLTLSMHGYLDIAFSSPWGKGWADIFGTFTLLSIWSAVRFERVYLDLNKYNRVLNAASRALGVAALLLILPLNTLPAGPWIYVIDVLAALTILKILLTIVITLRARVPNAKRFALSWTCFFVAANVAVLSRNGFIQPSLLTDMSIPFGIIIMMGSMSVFISSAWQSLLDAASTATAGETAAKLRLSEKQRLVKVLVHDINNPLTVIKSLTQVQARKFPDDLSWTKMSRATKHIDDMVQRVKMLEAAESGKVDVARSSVSLRDVLSELQFLFEERAATKGITLNTRFETSDPNPNVEGDGPLLIHSVFSNFVSNAIKFSHADSTIEITCADAPDGEVVVSVKDNGIGMDKQLIAKLFSDNAKTNRSGTGGETGTGFGMPLALSFLNKMGGHIEVTSVTNDSGQGASGTTFHIYLKRVTHALT
jgi:signal transduction histidine kinase